LDTLPLFKAALAEAMKACSLSRAQIADRVNELLQREGLKGDVTEAKLNKWAAPSDLTHVPALRLIPFLLLVVGTPAPLNTLLAPLGAVVAGPRERELMRLGQAQVDAKKAARLKRMAEAALEEL
jgi:hypothetical protein